MTHLGQCIPAHASDHALDVNSDGTALGSAVGYCHWQRRNPLLS
jgi:hypothetical protein